MDIKNTTDNIHVPSRELGLIWLEKINLLLEASQINKFNTDWFAWIDAGICIYRDSKPPLTNWPNIKKMNLIDENKFNYCTTDKEDIDNSIKDWNYIHNISGVFILHKKIIPVFHKLFYNYLNKCIKESNTFVCYSEQVILSHIYRDNPLLFNKVSSGYGTIISNMF